MLHFILQYLPFSLFVLLNRRKLTRAGVDKLVPLLHKTAAYTHDIISNVPAVNTINRNTINRHDVFACTLLHPELHNMCQCKTYICILL